MSEGKREDGSSRKARDARDDDIEGGGPRPESRKPGDARDRGSEGGASGKTGPTVSGPTRLTERQRRQARELRRKRDRDRSRTGGSSGAAVGNAISRGLKATAIETGRAIAFLGRGVRSLLDRFGSAALVLLGAILSVGSAVLGWAGGVVSAAAAGLARVALALDRILTPARGVFAAAILAGVLLAVSQFLDYRAVEIGSSGYDPILDLTRAPRTDVETPIGVHSIVLVLGSILALGSCLGLILTGRRVFAIPVIAAGALALAVGLAIDLPRGLDSAAASAAYADAEAVLLAGFWLEMASGATLAATGLLLFAGPAMAPVGSGDRRAAVRSRRGKSDRRRRRSRTTAGGTA